MKGSYQGGCKEVDSTKHEKPKERVKTHGEVTTPGVRVNTRKRHERISVVHLKVLGHSQGKKEFLWQELVSSPGHLGGELTFCVWGC